MTALAYVLIAADPGETRRVFEALGGIEGVVEKHEVMGPYDIVLRLEAAAMNELAGLVGQRIRTIPGIESTTTLIAFPT